MKLVNEIKLTKYSRRSALFTGTSVNLTRGGGVAAANTLSMDWAEYGGRAAVRQRSEAKSRDATEIAVS